LTQDVEAQREYPLGRKTEAVHLQPIACTKRRDTRILLVVPFADIEKQLSDIGLRTGHLDLQPEFFVPNQNVAFEIRCKERTEGQKPEKMEPCRRKVIVIPNAQFQPSDVCLALQTAGRCTRPGATLPSRFSEPSYVTNMIENSASRIVSIDCRSESVAATLAKDA
jgi:hypothetical protein